MKSQRISFVSFAWLVLVPTCVLLAPRVCKSSYFAANESEPDKNNNSKFYPSVSWTLKCNITHPQYTKLDRHAEYEGESELLLFLLSMFLLLFSRTRAYAFLPVSPAHVVPVYTKCTVCVYVCFYHMCLCACSLIIIPSCAVSFFLLYYLCVSLRACVCVWCCCCCYYFCLLTHNINKVVRQTAGGTPTETGRKFISVD